MAISVSDTTPRVEYTVGITGQTTFSVPFATEVVGDVAVFVNDVEATYVASLSGQTGTAFTLNNIGTASSTEVEFAIAQSSVTIDIIRDTTISRTSDYNTGGFFDIEDLNVELSRITRNLQDLELRVEQAISAPLQEGTPGTIPTASSRAGKLLAFDSDGAVTTKTSAITEYLGAFDADLVNRPDGTPLEVGDLYYNTTSTETRIWTGAATGWDLVFGRVQPLSTTYTSTGLTTLTLSARPSSVLSILIIIDGVLQNVNNYSLSNNVLTFTTAPPIGASVEVRDFSSTVSSGSGTIINLASGDEVTQANLDIAQLMVDLADVSTRIDTLQLSDSVQAQIANIALIAGRTTILENIISQSGTQYNSASTLITEQGLAITALQVLSTTLEGDLDQSVTGLKARVAALELINVNGTGNITLDINRITNLESNVFLTDGTTARNATVQEFDSLQATVNTAQGDLSAHATRLTSLESIVTGGTGTSVLATIATVNSVSTNASTALSTANAAAASVTTLNATVGTNTASIAQTAEVVSGTDGLTSKYGVKVSTNGYVSGFGLMSTANDALGTGTTQFVVNADRFWITDRTNQGFTPQVPFEVVNGVTNINNAVIEYLYASKIRGDVNKGSWAELASSIDPLSADPTQTQVLTLDIAAPDDLVTGHMPFCFASLYFSGSSDGIYGRLTSRTVDAVGGSVVGTEYDVFDERYEDYFVSNMHLNGGIHPSISATKKTTSAIRFTLYAWRDSTACTLLKANMMGWGLH